MIVFSCPTCRNAMQVPPEMAGQPVTCPFCHHGVLVPAAPPAPPAPHAPAPAPPPPPPEPLSLDDPEQEAAAAEEQEEEERRARAKRAAREAKQRRDSLIYIWAGAALTLLATVCGISLAPMIASDAKGVRNVTTAELLEIKDPASLPSPWISYTPEQPMIDTPLGTETKRRRGTSTKTRFVLVPVKDKWMVVERPEGTSGKKLQGELGKWDTNLGAEAMEKIKALHPDKRDKFLPIQLDETGGDPGNRGLVLTIGIGALGLFGLGSVVYGLVSRPKTPARRR